MDSPPDSVLSAFGLRGEPELLPGGQGGTWRVGDVVLKPVGFAAETMWRAEVLAGLPEGLGFRVARPVRAVDGTWFAGGWEASELLAGQTDAGRPDDVLTAGRAFHEALPAQVVHGDLLGNVMFADGVPPAIIDWPVYWRPPAWASAVAVVDALCWYDADPELAARWSHLPEWGQMLVRALIYRMVTDDIARGPAVWTPDHHAAYRPVIDLAISYTR